jgi:antitoxin VapB
MKTNMGTSDRVIRTGAALAIAALYFTGRISGTLTIVLGLHERLERESHRARRGIDTEVRRIQERIARLPPLDPRSADEILGYDEHGLPR